MIRILLYSILLVGGAWITGCQTPIDKQACAAKCAPNIMDYWKTNERNSCVCDLTKETK